jgi:cobalt-precorrin 5A hydrolase
VSTASDSIGTLTVDILGRAFGWTLADPDHNVTRGCAAVVNSDRVLFVQETGEPDFWPLDKALPSGVAYATSLDGVDPSAWDMLLICSDRDLARLAPEHYARGLVYRPKSLALGLGCDRDTPTELVERGITTMLADLGLSLASVKAIASVDKKADERAFLELSAKYGWPFTTYPASQLDAVPGIETPSATVLKHVGTRGVSEPAALLAAGATALLAPKRVYTEPGAGRSMTMAVARIPFATRPEAGAHS